MITQVIRDTYGVITTGKFCQFGVRKKANTGGGDNGGQIPSNEMHFTTISGLVDYVGTQGDQILLSDGTIVDVTITDDTFTFNAPEGKHRVKLVESVDRSNYVGLGGEALVELHNFPTLSTVTRFNFAAYTSDARNLTIVPEFLPSNITDISNLFHAAINFNQDISMWDTSNVLDMYGVFWDAIAFNQDLNRWNVSNVNTTWNMFYGATSFNQPLNNWDVSNVTNMNSMFYDTIEFNQDISSWDVSNVTNMGGMFNGAITFNQDLSGWCVSNIPSLPYEFDLGATSWSLPKPVWGTCPA